VQVIDLSDEFLAEQFMRNPHSGTHIDFPAYLFEDERKLGDFGLERFVGDAVVLDLTGKKPGEWIEDEDLEAAEEAAGLALRERESVILYTGMGVGSASACLSRNGAEYLEFKRVGLVGIDAANIDGSGSGEMAAHRVLLGKDILVLEGLRNLGSIDESRFRLASFPLRVRGVTAPVRAVAILE